MSDCSGPDCTHPSHQTVAAQVSNRTREVLDVLEGKTPPPGRRSTRYAGPVAPPRPIIRSIHLKAALAAAEPEQVQKFEAANPILVAKLQKAQEKRDRKERAREWREWAASIGTKHERR